MTLSWLQSKQKGQKKCPESCNFNGKMFYFTPFIPIAGFDDIHNDSTLAQKCFQCTDIKQRFKS